jgi:methionyl-tRNA formyltransferase
MKFAFFGTPDIAVHALEALTQAGFVPSLIVTNPDRPTGRKQILTPPPAAVFAETHNIPLFQPESLKDKDAISPLTATDWDLFVVVAYGKIIPEWLLSIPKHQTINLHPSLLPKFRGASPIRSSILADERETGVTIILLDAEMDHGPILTQEIVTVDESEWPLDGQLLDERLARAGGALLAETIPEWIAGQIEPQEQDHDAATFCTKITKDMSELAIDPYHLPEGMAAYDILLKIKAFSGWPETFFIHENKRVKIKSACLENEKLHIDRIVPEGKSEMDFNAYFT